MELVGLISAISGLITLANSKAVQDLAASLKALIDSAFKANIITAAQQNALKARVDADAALKLAGIPPAHWTVQPDPGAEATVLGPTCDPSDPNCKT